MDWFLEKNVCTGCGACVAVCPSHCVQMTADENGFLFPIVSEKQCVSCKLCEKTCPVINSDGCTCSDTTAYAVFSKDPDIRAQSSSGGVFSELAVSVLSDGGTVYGAAYGPDYSIQHIGITSIDQLNKLRGAKYAQSDLGECFKKIKGRLDEGQRVLFSGAPCQVAGLKSFLHKEYNNLICVDFVCHGVPSPEAWRRYVKYRAKVDNNGVLPHTINMRAKDTGWSRYKYSSKYEYDHDKVHLAQNGHELFMKLFVDNYISRESCSNCHFKGYERTSDITLGDFWGIWDIIPEIDDNKGISVVLVHSRKGKALICEIENRLHMQKVSLEDASRQNSSMLKSSPAHEKREAVLDLARKDNFERIEKMVDFNAKGSGSFFDKVKRKLKSSIFFAGKRQN